MKYTFSILLFSLSGFLSIYGQQDTVSVDSTIAPVELELISTYHDNRIILRWAPVSADGFIRSIAQPYLIERFDVRSDSAMLDIASRKEIIITPWEEIDFKPYMELDEPYILAAGQVMYGESEVGSQGGKGFASAYEEVINRYGIALLATDMDAKASEAMAWRYEDADVVEGKSYFYRIQLADTSIADIPVYKSELAVAPERPAPIIASTIEAEGNIGLFWSQADYRSLYSGFHIERSRDGETYARITDVPLVYARSDDYAGEQITFRDSISNYEGHYYRLIGVSPFGFESAPSEPVFAIGRDRTPPLPPMNLYVDTDTPSSTVNLSWELPDDPDVAGVEIFRSYQQDGVQESISTILSSDTESFTDTIRDRIQFHYYAIATVDTAGNYAYTIPHIASFRDTVPPDAPVGLTGSIDTNGIVTISWSDNAEPDLMGYSVFFANQDDHMYANVYAKPRRDTFFIDTLQLNTTTEEIFYKVIATDFNYHVSEFSVPLVLKKPDIIPPLPPRFRSYRQEEGKVILDLVTSKAKDAESQVLYRKSHVDTAFIALGTIEQGVFIDDQVLRGMGYTYQAIVTDDDGLTAMSELIIKTKNNKKPDAPIALTAIYDSENKLINITWESKEDSGTFIIYRSMNGGPFIKLNLIEGSSYSDKRNIIPEKLYSYKVKAERPNGIRSDFSEEVSISTQDKSLDNER